MRELHTLEVTPAVAAIDRFPLIPLDVGDDVAEIRVSYRASDAERIDIGLVDARGAGPGLPGFRGWSGSARSGFTVREDAATPGYLPGPIDPGRWSVIIGLYQVPGPCRIEVTVDLADSPGSEVLDEGPSTVAATRGVSALDGPRVVDGMVAGDLHAHTVHSNDAANPIPVADLVAAAEGRGLGFLAVTDHNTVSHHAHLARLQGETFVRLIPGVEVTTYEGHMNVWGVDHPVDWRGRPAVPAGAVASICHPKAVGPPWLHPVPDGLAAVEAWGAPWIWANGESLAFWERLVRQGRRLTAVGGSDIHDFTARPGHGVANPATWVPVAEDPLAAVRVGRVSISQSSRGPLVVPVSPEGEAWPGSGPVRASVTGGKGGRLRALDARGVIREAEIDDDHVLVDGGAGEGYVRYELWGPGTFASGPVTGRLGALWAMSNPVYAD